MALSSSPPAGPARGAWTPIRVDWVSGEPWLDWCRTAGVSFTEPFFDQTIERCLRHPFNLLFRRRTGIDALPECGPSDEPSGFVFHLSRCGSTLVGQMLGAVPSYHVVSEAGPVQSVVRARERAPQLSPEVQQRWLRNLVGALGRRDDGEPRAGYVVKMDAWSSVHLDLVRSAFPNVPWVFVFRDPLEVLSSQMRRLAAQFLPGELPLGALGIEPTALAEMSGEEYCARVLARIVTGALRHADDPAGRYVGYDELPGAVYDVVLPWFGLEPGPDGSQAMARAALRDAKHPSVPFAPEPSDHRQARPELREQVERWLLPLHRQLDEARRRQRRRTLPPTE